MFRRMSYGDSANPFMGDYRVALIRNPKVDLAVAVAASSAFPPFLSPAVLKLNPADFDPTTKGAFNSNRTRPKWFLRTEVFMTISA